MYSFQMRHHKDTPYKAVFKEAMNRIGRIYVPHELKNKLGIMYEIIVQIDTDKKYLPMKGYITTMKLNKEYGNCVRFKENITELGEIGYIYVQREVLEALNVNDVLAVRIDTI
ncbi:hypothetical protein [Desulfotomaculum copahuensis]|nr:hypothetical protein [Desulfotomaculum copahuensis]